MRPIYTNAARSPQRPRGKWHLLFYRTGPMTLCGQDAREWVAAERADLDPNDICANCLGLTP